LRGGEEDPADFEQGDAFVFAVEIVAERIEQAGQQAGRSTFMSLLSGFCRGTGRQGMRTAGGGLGDQGLALGFVESQADQETSDLRVLVEDGVERVAADGAAGRSGRDLVDAVQAGDFFDQVRFAFQVHSERGIWNVTGSGGDEASTGVALRPTILRPSWER
jgi:hypothetical protein